jgi:hypothetical protein
MGPVCARAYSGPGTSPKLMSFAETVFLDMPSAAVLSGDGGKQLPLPRFQSLVVGISHERFLDNLDRSGLRSRDPRFLLEDLELLGRKLHKLESRTRDPKIPAAHDVLTYGPDLRLSEDTPASEAQELLPGGPDIGPISQDLLEA